MGDPRNFSKGKARNSKEMQKLATKPNRPRAGSVIASATVPARSAAAGADATLPHNNNRKSPVTLGDARLGLAQAFEQLGGVDGLVEWGKTNPTHFYQLWGRLVPRNSEVSIAAVPLEDMLERLANADKMRGALSGAYKNVTDAVGQVRAAELLQAEPDPEPASDDD